MPIHANPLLAAAAMLLATAAGAQDQPAPDGAVMARMQTADGTDIGTVTLRSMRSGVLVETDLTDLPPGPHGIHIHQTGACTPDFEAAGEHLAPTGPSTASRRSMHRTRATCRTSSSPTTAPPGPSS